MDILSHEKIIEEHEFITLTDKAVIQEKESWMGNSSYVEIPIEKIDSISRTHVFKKVFLVLAFFLLLFGAYFYNIEHDFETLISFSAGALLSLMLYIFTAKKELIIKAGNEIIYENARGAGKFVKKLREQIYR